jgi:hypothetical protein
VRRFSFLLLLSQIDSGVGFSAWPGGPPEDRPYAELLSKRLDRTGMNRTCVGHIGGDLVCSLNGVLVMSSGIAVADEPWALTLRRREHADAFRASLALYSALSRWRICSWHAVARSLNTGDLPRGVRDDPGYEMYRICVSRGGIVANGHEHSYARSKSLAEIRDNGSVRPHEEPWYYAPRPATMSNGQLVPARPELIVLGPGSGLVLTNGLGGQDLRTPGEGKTGLEKWWGKTLTTTKQRWHRNDAAESGALLCTFGRTPTHAPTLDAFIALYELPADIFRRITDLHTQSGHCEFKLVSGQVYDEFDLLNVNEVDEPLQAKETAQSFPSVLADVPLSSKSGAHGLPTSPVSLGFAPSHPSTDSSVHRLHHGDDEHETLSTFIFVVFLCLTVVAGLVAYYRLTVRRKRREDTRYHV